MIKLIAKIIQPMVDNYMNYLQKSPKVGIYEWNRAQKRYKNVYGKSYQPK